MTNLADIPVPVPSPPGTRCRVATIRDRLTPADLAVFDARLVDRAEWSDLRMTWVVDGMIENGLLPKALDSGQSVFCRHRNGKCRCPRGG